MVKIQWDGTTPANASEFDAALDAGPQVNPTAQAAGRVLRDGGIEVTFSTLLGRGGWVPRSDAAAAEAQERQRMRSDAVEGSYTVNVRTPAQLQEAVLRHYAKARDAT